MANKHKEPEDVLEGEYNFFRFVTREHIVIFFKVISLILPSFLVYSIMLRPEIVLMRGQPVIGIVDEQKIDRILPNTRWGHLTPCSKWFNEYVEFNKVIQCVNSKLFKNDPILDLALPRCYVISVNSMDVFASDDKKYNFLVYTNGLNYTAMVGFYQEDTNTIFIVENVDTATVYRHEVQHFILDVHTKIGSDINHSHDIWKYCEANSYCVELERHLNKIENTVGRK